MQHPNATVGAGGTGLGVLVVWFLGNVWPHAEISAEAGVAITGAVITAVLFVGRHGLAGIARMIWKGNGA